MRRGRPAAGADGLPAFAFEHSDETAVPIEMELSDLYRGALQTLDPIERIELEAMVLHFAGAKIDPLDPDQWEAMGWRFIDKARRFAAEDEPD